MKQKQIKKVNTPPQKILNQFLERDMNIFVLGNISVCLGL